MIQDFLIVGEVRTKAHPGSYRSAPALARQSGSRLSTLELRIPILEHANIANGSDFFCHPGSQVRGFALSPRVSPKREDKHMKSLTLATVAAACAALTLPARRGHDGLPRLS